MNDKQVKVILSAITMTTTIFEIVVQYRNQIKRKEK